jgi:hypothetical protein
MFGSLSKYSGPLLNDHAPPEMYHHRNMYFHLSPQVFMDLHPDALHTFPGTGEVERPLHALDGEGEATRSIEKNLLWQRGDG